MKNIFKIKINVKNKISKTGFTILEMIVALGIFAMMTALVLTRYSNFNQGVILTNLAYDVALTIRNAQSYGLNVKSADRNDNKFLFTRDAAGGSYGVDFDMKTPTVFTFFSDVDNNGYFDDIISPINQKTTIQRASSIKSICVSNEQSCTPNNSQTYIANTDWHLDISFKRPDPNAIIKIINSNTDEQSGPYAYAEVVLQAVDGTIRKVIINSTGQISVE